MAEQRQAGFSLLELLVAFAIMALSLALLYRVLGGSADTALSLDRRHQALLLAQSVLSLRPYVPPGGTEESGESAGMVWTLRAVPANTSVVGGPRLYRVEVLIRAGAEADAPLLLELATLRAERRRLPGEGA